MRPLISIVIVNYNGKKFLDDCLSSLNRQKFRNFEIILVDNGSSDDSVSFTRENYPGVIMVENKTNLGFAGGTNTGIRLANGEFILTLNNDTITDTQMLEEIVRPMQLNSNVGVCGTKMILPDGRINSTAICISHSGAAWDRGMDELDMGQYDNQEEVFGACAGAALYRRSMFEEIGLFDEDFFLYSEDVDLAFRAQLAGWKCLYVPSARVVHVHGGTAGPGSEMAVYFLNRNLLWYILKNFPIRALFLSMPWILARNCCDVPYYFLQKRGRAIVKAKIDAIRGIRNILRKRKMIKKNVPDEEIIKWIQRNSRLIPKK
jgi:GT2 family glycosyltransferase